MVVDKLALLFVKFCCQQATGFSSGFSDRNNGSDGYDSVLARVVLLQAKSIEGVGEGGTGAAVGTLAQKLTPFRNG